jgi:hypothetical protein
MKIVTINMELVISNMSDDYVDVEKVCEYLNNKLYTDPEFFGDFGPENIINIQDVE